MKPNLKMAIIRPIGFPLSRNFYNCQELGLARGLSRCGISVDVYVAGAGRGVVHQTVESAGPGVVRLIEVPFFRIPEIDHAIYPKLCGLLRNGKYDFIQVNEENELTSFLVARVARKSRIPVVVYQGMYQQLTGRIRAAFQSLYDKVLLPEFRRNISLALTKTERARMHLARKGFQQIVTLPVGLDPTPFSASVERDWRSEFSIPQRDMVLLYVGILEARRNVDFMLDMARQLSGDDVTLVIAGSGPEEERMVRRIRDEEILNVRLVGRVAQEQLPSLYRDSSLFLLPSNYEIYGMVVLEAMYFGVPVLSTATAGPEDIIKNGVDGFLEGLDLGAWVAVARKLAVDRRIGAAMGQQAREKVQNLLTWDSIARDYSAYIKALVHGGG